MHVKYRFHACKIQSVNTFLAPIWPLGAWMWASGCSQLMQAQIGTVEEDTTASKQLLFHGRQAAPLLNESQHLQTRGDASHYVCFQSQAAGAFIFIANWQLGHQNSSKSKKNTPFHYLHFSIFRIHLSWKLKCIQKYVFKNNSFSDSWTKPIKAKNGAIYIYFQSRIQRKSPDNIENMAPGTKANWAIYQNISQLKSVYSQSHKIRHVKTQCMSIIQTVSYQLW